jgi:hypothetical protein
MVVVARIIVGQAVGWRVSISVSSDHTMLFWRKQAPCRYAPLPIEILILIVFVVTITGLADHESI